MNLSFINANWYRKYPLRATASSDLPTDLLVGARLMVTSDICSNVAELYVRRVIIQAGLIIIELSANGEIVGLVKGEVTQNNQTLSVTAMKAGISGFLIIGNSERLVEKQIFDLDPAAGQFEDSVVTFFPVPDVKGFQHNQQSVKGHVRLASDNLVISSLGNKVTIDVLSPDDIASRMDRTAELLTCANPVIGSINSVLPNKQGELSIYGVLPVAVSISGGLLTVDTPDLTLEDACKPVSLPPLEESNAYYTDLLTAEHPEWRDWPQYNI